MPRISGPAGSNTTVASPTAAPLLRQGASGSAVASLQKALAAAGFGAGSTDGSFGPKTRAAVVAFQRARGLSADGVVGPKTWAALATATGPSTPSTPSTGGVTDSFDAPTTTVQYAARGTGYYPDSSALEGGFVDRKGAPLHTLQDFLAGRSTYVSVAMDSTAFPYGTALTIPQMDAAFGRHIPFKVVDTGSAFKGKGTSRIDICTASARDSLDPTINGPLTLIPKG